MDYMFEGKVTLAVTGNKTNVYITLYRTKEQRLAFYLAPPLSPVVVPSFARPEQQHLDGWVVQATPLPSTEKGTRKAIQVQCAFEVETTIPTILIIHAWSKEHGVEEWELPYLLLHGQIINLHMPLDYINLQGEVWLDLPPLSPNI
jgi:hypothetical protein